MKRGILAIALGAVVIASPAWAEKKRGAAKADKGDDDSDDEDTETKKKPDAKKDAKKADAGKTKKADAAKKKSGDDDDDDSDDDKKADAKKGNAKADAAKKKSDDDDDSGDDDDDDSSGGFKGSTKNVTKDTGETPMVKQDLNGHDMGARKRTTAFEKDRFFVDKSDTAKTEKGTLIQGSLTSSTFGFHESGGALTANPLTMGEASSDSRMFTDLRLQTDFRHINGGRWDARIDGRIRFVNSGYTETETMAVGAAPTANVQSGLLGGNEYDLRELWLIRNGERTDVTIGRQYVLDLAAVKIDGVRVDYASSPQLTYLGFAGLYPFRGSRSLSTDYIDLKNPTDGTPAGRFIGTGGFGAAYRTSTAYGAFGGVTQVPLEAEQPRVFGTANGYWRVNPKIDIYHYALIDLVSSYGAQLTNLTGGINYKPTQRLRMTASYNRVDTETLNIQAGAYLDTPQTNSAVQNETFVSRLATNETRGSISAGLGNLERVEVTVAAAYRSRPGFTLTPTPMGATPVPPITLSAERGYEIYGSIVDRHSFGDARIGIDAVQTFANGTVAFQRDEVFAVRGFVARELQSGKGEWEAEVSYATTRDTNDGGTNCLANLNTCFGETNGSVLSLGGALYYRIDHDWFIIGQAYVSQTSLTQAGMAADPSILGLSGYFRIAYRF